MEIKTTRAVAIYEGGGVHGIAYLGAYQAAKSHKFKFEGAAGTSVGSIAAAFTAANFSEDEITAAIGSLEGELKNFQAPAYRGRSKRTAVALGPLLALSKVPLIKGLFKNLHHMAAFALCRGFYSSDFIRDWVNGQLVKCLKQRGDFKRDTVVFKDLPLPCAMIATKLAAPGVEIYSTEQTPTMSVGEAVLRSCCVPVFFRPIESKNGNDSAPQFVDGGLLANLPLTLSEKLDGCDELPMIAFRTVAHPGEGPDTRRGPIGIVRKMKTYFASIASAIIEGNAELQRQQLTYRRTSIVNIKVGEVSFIDFNLDQTQQKDLISAGYDAAHAELEDLPLRAEMEFRNTAKTLRVRRGGVVRLAVHRMQSAENEIRGMLPDIKALLDLMPAIIVAKDKKPELTIRLIIAKRPEDDLDQGLPEHLGCEVRYVKNLHVTGLLCDDPHERGNRSGMIIEDREGDVRQMRVLDSGDVKLLCLYWDYFDTVWHQTLGPQRKPDDPELVCISDDRMIDALRNVAQYNAEKIKFEVNREFKIDDALPVKNRLEEWLVRRVHYIKSASECMKVNFCDCVRLRGTLRVSCPPVVELHNDQHYVVRGHHRFWYAFDHGESTIPVIVVKGVVDDLPGKSGHRWDDIRILDQELEKENQYADYVSQRERKIGDQLGILGAQLHREEANP